MKKVALLSAFVFGSLLMPAQSFRVDTIYYDKNWETIPVKEFADYYRVVLISNDLSIKNRFKDYYITGELLADGFFVSFEDEQNKKGIIFDGEISTFSKNGNKTSCNNYKNGALEGKCTEYFENGLIKREFNIKDGKYDGLCTQFNDDGSIIQLEYANGEPTRPYYFYTSKDGLTSKIDLKTQEVYWDKCPKTSERKTVYRNGIAWQYYAQNNLVVALTNTLVKDYGRWHRIEIIITNNSIVPIEFDPSQISATMVNKRGELDEVHVWSCDEFMNKVKRNQNWAAAMVGIAEGLSTANAGRTTSTTTSSTTYNGNSNVYGNASAYGSNGNYAYGSFSGYGNYNGSVNTVTTTNTYDASAAYQTNILSQQRIAALENAQWEERASLFKGYLKKTTIYPGESISGYVHVERKDGEKIRYYVPVGDLFLQYEWNY